MMRRVAIFLFLFFFQAAQSQVISTSTRSEDRTVDLQITLGFDDGSAFQPPSTGQSTVSDTGKDRSGSNTGKHAQEMSSNMQIRVQLQEILGGGLDESSPNGEGRVTFRVRNGSTYRIRVVGPEIEEAVVERVEPSRGDRLLSVRLHHKEGAKISAKASAAPAPVVRLNIPPNAQKELDRGNAALDAQDYATARRHFEKGIELYPQFDMAYNNLGVVLMNTGDAEGGRKAFAKAIELNDHFARAYLNLGKLALESKNFAEADEFLRKCLSNDPLNPRALGMAAEAAYGAGKFEDAIADVRTLHSVPHDAFAVTHYFAGLSQESLHHPDAAIKEFELFLTEAPGDANAAKARAKLDLLRLELQAR